MSFDTTGLIVPGSSPDKPMTLHDPQARLDYKFGLTGLVDTGDDVTDATFTVHLNAPNGAVQAGVSATLKGITNTLGPETHDVWVWLQVTDQTLAGKIIGVTCHWTTSGGREDERTLYFKLKDL